MYREVVHTSTAQILSQTKLVILTHPWNPDDVLNRPDIVDVFSPSLSSPLVVASNPLRGLTGTLLWASAHFGAVQLSEYHMADRYHHFVKLDPWRRVLMPSIDAVCAPIPVLA